MKDQLFEDDVRGRKKWADVEHEDCDDCVHNAGGFCCHWSVPLTGNLAVGCDKFEAVNERREE